MQGRQKDQMTYRSHVLSLLMFGCMVAAFSQQPTSAGFPTLDAATLAVGAKIHTGGDPDWLATGFGSIWVSVPKKNQIVRINPRTNIVQARIAVGQEPCYGIGIGATYAWVLNCKSQTLTRIDPVRNKVNRTVAVSIAPEGEGSIAVAGSTVWFVSNKDGHSSTLANVDARGRSGKTVPVGTDSAVVAAAFGSIWVTSSGEAKVYRIDPAQHRVIATISVPAMPRFTTAGAGSLWVLNQSDGSVSRIDPGLNKVVATIQVKVPGAGGDIAYGGGYIWVAAAGTPLSKIDPRTNSVVVQYGNYKGADAVRFGAGSIWISDHGKGDIWRIDPARIVRPPVEQRDKIEAGLRKKKWRRLVIFVNRTRAFYVLHRKGDFLFVPPA
jgi:virginiamycin B lyase